MSRWARAMAATLLVGGPSSLALVATATPACAAGEIRVSVVVDFGDLPDPPSTTATCVPASDGDNGAEALAARAKQLGRPAPRYNSSGLLCAIDGLPSTGCGERTSSGYRYWSYFHGSAAGWQYSGVGPTSSRVKAGQSEGWRFTDGTGRPGDPAPRGPADPAAVCQAPSSPPAPAAPAPSPGATAAPGGGSSAARPTPTAAPVATSSTAVGGATPTTGVVPVEATSTTTSTTTVDTDAEAASNTRRAPPDSDEGGRAAGTAVGALAVVALLGGGAIAARRRQRT